MAEPLSPGQRLLSITRSPESLLVPLQPWSGWRGPDDSTPVTPCLVNSWLDSPTSSPSVPVVVCLRNLSLSRGVLGCHVVCCTGSSKGCEWGKARTVLGDSRVPGCWRAGVALHTVPDLSIRAVTSRCLFQGDVCVPCRASPQPFVSLLRVAGP